MKAVVDHHDAQPRTHVIVGAIRRAAGSPSRCTTRPPTATSTWASFGSAGQSGIFLHLERALKESLCDSFAADCSPGRNRTFAPLPAGQGSQAVEPGWRRRPDAFPTPDQASTAHIPQPQVGTTSVPRAV